jgi:hypothetical protein
MTTHSSAAAHDATPHVIQTTRTPTIINALKRIAQAVLNDESIDARSRAIIRYGLETNDPWLANLVQRIEAGETIVDTPTSQKHLTQTKMPQSETSRTNTLTDARRMNMIRPTVRLKTSSKDWSK